MARLWGGVGCGGCAVGLGWLRYEHEQRTKGKDQTKGTYIYKKGVNIRGQVRFVHRLDKGETKEELF